MPQSPVKTFWLSVLAVIAVSAPGVVCAQMPGGGPQGPVPVGVENIQREEMRIWKEFPGRLTAVDSAHVIPQVSGRITEVHFEDGQRVEKGDVLLVIDPRPYEAALLEAKAALQAAQSRVKQANKDFKRAEELVKTKALSQRVFDERKSARAAARADVDRAKAMLQRAEINLDYAHVKAPIAGRVGRVEVTQGNVVQAGPGAPVLTEIVADAKIYVDFEVDEQTYLSHIRTRAKDLAHEQLIPVQAILNKGPGGGETHIIGGVIHAFDNRINPASGTIRARAVLSNADGAMLPGMFVNVRLGSPEPEGIVSVSEAAVSTDQDRKYVYVVDENSAVEYRQVTLGARVGEKRVVLSGLAAGDQVIVDGLMKIRPGMKVQPMINKRGRR